MKFSYLLPATISGPPCLGFHTSHDAKRELNQLRPAIAAFITDFCDCCDLKWSILWQNKPVGVEVCDVLKVRLSVQGWHLFVTHDGAKHFSKFSGANTCNLNQAISVSKLLHESCISPLPHSRLLSFTCFLPFPSLRFSFCGWSEWFWLWRSSPGPVCAGPFGWAAGGWRRSPARALGSDWFCRSPGRSGRSPARTDRQLSSAGGTIPTFVRKVTFIEKRLESSGEAEPLPTFKLCKPDWWSWQKHSGLEFNTFIQTQLMSDTRGRILE